MGLGLKIKGLGLKVKGVGFKLRSGSEGES